MDAKTMLEVGKECGLQTVRECYDNVMMHYDVFFSIDNYDKETNDFENDIDKYGLELADNTEEGLSKIDAVDLGWNEVEDSQNKNLLGC